MPKKQNPEPEQRRYRVDFYIDRRLKRPVTSGYPKTLNGEYGKSNGAAGALRVIAQGYANKVVITDRRYDRVVLTAIGEDVPGVRVRGVRVVKGEA